MIIEEKEKEELFQLLHKIESKAFRICHDEYLGIKLICKYSNEISKTIEILFEKLGIDKTKYLPKAKLIVLGD